MTEFTPEKLTTAAERVIRECGFTLRWVDLVVDPFTGEPLPPPVYGLTLAGEGRRPAIQVRYGLTPLACLQVLLHEMAHATLHSPQFKGRLQHFMGPEASNAVLECEADTVSFAVLRHFGLGPEFDRGYTAALATLRPMVHDVAEELARQLRAFLPQSRI